MRWTVLVSTVTVILFTGSIGPDSAGAGAAMWAKAKEKGYPARSCQYCHVSAMPKKEAFKPDDLNDRGTWLMAEKDRQKAKAIDVEWLKSYPGGKEQK